MCEQVRWNLNMCQMQPVFTWCKQFMPALSKKAVNLWKMMGWCCHSCQLFIAQKLCNFVENFRCYAKRVLVFFIQMNFSRLAVVVDAEAGVTGNPPIRKRRFSQRQVQVVKVQNMTPFWYFFRRYRLTCPFLPDVNHFLWFFNKSKQSRFFIPLSVPVQFPLVSVWLLLIRLPALLLVLRLLVLVPLFVYLCAPASHETVA